MLYFLSFSFYKAVGVCFTNTFSFEHHLQIDLNRFLLKIMYKLIKNDL